MSENHDRAQLAALGARPSHTEHGATFSAAALAARVAELETQLAAALAIAEPARAWHAAMRVAARARAAVPTDLTPLNEDHPAIRAWADAAVAWGDAAEALIAALREDAEREIGGG